MRFADIKPGMRAIVTGSNEGRPGGHLNKFIGKKFTVGEFRESGGFRPRNYNPDYNGENVWGYFRLVDIEEEGKRQDNIWVLHPSQFNIIVDEKGNPVVDGVIKKKPLRGADGRFLPKEGKKAPVKEKEEPVLDEEGKLEKALREALKAEREPGLDVSTNGLRLTDGSYKLNPHDICAYRWYPSTYNNKCEATHAIVIIDDYYVKYDDETKKLYREFLLYMFHDSPWKDCFLTKNIEHALKHCVSFDVNQKRSHVVNAQQVMRQFSEFEFFRKTYKSARNAGFAVKHAVFIACFFQNDVKGFSARAETGHSCVNKWSDVMQLQKTFGEGVLNDCGDLAYKIPTGYLGPICNAVALSLGQKNDKAFYNVAKRIACKTEDVGWDARAARFTAVDLALVVGFVFG